MGGKVISRLHLSMLNVNILRLGYLNLMKLGNHGPTGEGLNLIKAKFYCFFFHNNFKATKDTKMADPILEFLLKTRLIIDYCDIV